jgi:small-conductance mechanosensitive channel
MVNCTVTIGYDVPWRQVHALLELAAGRKSNILKTLKPHVLQRQLSDFYIQYTLVARLDDEAQRVQRVSDLHAAIQDAFNEFGVQIMSPHFMMQPNGSVVVPREKWALSPAVAPAERTEAPDRGLIG